MFTKLLFSVSTGLYIQVDTKSEAKLYQEIVADNSQLEEEEEEPLSFTPISWNEDDFKERKGTLKLQYCLNFFICF